MAEFNSAYVVAFVLVCVSFGYLTDPVGPALVLAAVGIHALWIVTLVARDRLNRRYPCGKGPRARAMTADVLYAVAGVLALVSIFGVSVQETAAAASGVAIVAIALSSQFDADTPDGECPSDQPYTYLDGAL